MKLSLLFSALLLISAQAFAEVPPVPSCNSSTMTVSAQAGLPIIIPTTYSTVVATVIVSGAGSYLWDLDVTTNLFHTSPRDLEIVLRSPAGTEITLAKTQGRDADNAFNGTLWDDQASPGDAIPYEWNPRLVTDSAYVGGLPAPRLVPQEGFEALRGENPNGLWTLRIVDSGLGDGGILTGWSLSLTTLSSAPTIGAPIVVANTTPQNIPTNSRILLSSSVSVDANVPAGTTVCGVELDTNIEHSNPSTLRFGLESPTGRFATVSSGNGGFFDHVFAGTAWRMSADAAPASPNQSRLVTTYNYQNLSIAPLLVPEESFGTFLGQPLAGVWKLWVHDNHPLEGGALSSWNLKVYPCPEPNRDFDALPDSCDACPTDPRKVIPGVCGCGVAEIDSDGDGTPDCIDTCRLDRAKSSAGSCGCGVSERDTDRDGTADCVDSCPLSPTKTSPGICGCNQSDVDANNNGIIDCLVQGERSFGVRKRAIALRQIVENFSMQSGRIKRRAIRANFAALQSVYGSNPRGTVRTARTITDTLKTPMKRLLRQRALTFEQTKKQVLKTLDTLLSVVR